MTENYSLWDRLAKKEKPLVVYGTGNGADKIFDVLLTRGITPDAVFASDGFVRERTFRGYTVRSYSDIIAEYGKEITILLAFGTTLPTTREFIHSLDEEHELIIPDVPLYGGDLFDYGYFSAHRQSLQKAASLLSDERSTKIFEDAVNFRLTGKLRYLSDTESVSTTLIDLFGGQNISAIIDGGAYKGDSTEEFVRCLSPRFITAVEADQRTYRKLCDYAEAETRCEVVPVNALLSDSVGECEYISSASRGSGENGHNRRAKVVTVPKTTIDAIVGDKQIDFIKLDVEGNERETLNGARGVILRDRPNLAVSLYHRTDDLFELVELVHSLLPEHELFLRRVPCIPMWDLVLYAVRQ